MSSVRHRLSRLEARSGRPEIFVANPWTCGDEPSGEDIRRHQVGLQQALLNPRAQILIHGNLRRDPFNVRQILVAQR